MKLVSDKNEYIFFLLPVFGIIIAVAIYPLCYELYLSFRSYNALRPWYPREFVGLGNYFHALSNPRVWRSLRITFTFIIATVVIELIFGMGIALLFNRELKGKSIFRTLIMLPLTLTPVVVGLIWKYLVHDTFGVVTYVFKYFGLSTEFYGSPITALPTMILIDVWQWTPFVFLILLAGLLSLPKEPFESAKIDGASELQCFWYMTVPLLKPIITIAILLRLVDAIKIFDTIWILTKGGPGHATEVYNIFIYLEGFRYYNMGYAAALGIILLIISLVVTFGFIKLVKLDI